MFTGLSTAICETAWSMVLPAVKHAADQGITNKLAGTIIVLDPREKRFTPGEYLFSDQIDSDQPEKYTIIAADKAKLTLETGLPSGIVQQQYPYLYKKNDVKWGGSTIAPGGLVVAFSGVQAVFDEMVSEWMVSAIRALCRWEMTSPDGVMNQNITWIGNDRVIM